MWEYGLKLVVDGFNLFLRECDFDLTSKSLVATGLPGTWEAPHCYLLTWFKDPEPPELNSCDHQIHIYIPVCIFAVQWEDWTFYTAEMALLGPQPFFCTASGKKQVVCVENIAVLPGSQSHMDMSHGFKSASYSVKQASTTLACRRTNTWAVQKDISLGSRNCIVQLIERAES